MPRAILIAALAGLIVLFLLTVITTLWPTRVYADEYPAFLFAGDDTVEIRASSEGHVAEIEYKNSTPPGTSFGRKVVQHGDLIVEVFIGSGVEGSERIRITPMGVDLIAVPEVIDVPDGQGVVVQLMRAMF